MIIKTKQFLQITEIQNIAFILECKNILKSKFENGFEKINVKKQDEDLIITNGIKDARSYGVTLKEDIVLYLECILLLGVNFDKKKGEMDWPNKILTNQDLSGESKMNHIHENLIYSILV